jgi:hypothetical protein
VQQLEGKKIKVLQGLRCFWQEKPGMLLLCLKKRSRVYIGVVASHNSVIARARQPLAGQALAQPGGREK